jgi:SAM-dependent methyltransferase
MYSKSARYYDALYHSKDYAAASEQVHEWIRQRQPQATTLLDVGCGTAKHLEHLRRHYVVEGLDLSPEMIAVARSRCPGVPFHQGDMVNFRLGRTFDAVTCLFSAIGSVRSLDRLDRAVQTMADHLAPGGVLIVEPWFGPDNYWAGRIVANFVDEPDLKVAWMYRTAVEGRISRFDIHYLVATAEGVEHFAEPREVGLFTEQEYTEAFLKAGLDVQHDSQAVFGRGAYIGAKRVAPTLSAIGTSDSAGSRQPA